MNRRALGCGIAAAAVFVGIGLLGLWLVTAPPGCPDRLQWEDRAYAAKGGPAPEPSLPEGEPVRIGTTFIGMTTRDVYGPPGSEPLASQAVRPEVIVLACGDGTFRAYRSGG